MILRFPPVVFPGQKRVARSESEETIDVSPKTTFGRSSCDDSRRKVQKAEGKGEVRVDMGYRKLFELSLSQGTEVCGRGSERERRRQEMKKKDVDWNGSGEDGARGEQGSRMIQGRNENQDEMAKWVGG